MLQFMTWWGPFLECKPKSKTPTVSLGQHFSGFEMRRRISWPYNSWEHVATTLVVGSVLHVIAQWVFQFWNNCDIYIYIYHVYIYVKQLWYKFIYTYISLYIYMYIYIYVVMLPFKRKPISDRIWSGSDPIICKVGTGPTGFAPDPMIAICNDKNLARIRARSGGIT